MAFGNSIMSRFSEDLLELDPAYECMLDSEGTFLDAFMNVACENTDPYYPDDDYDDDDWDDEYEDDDEDEWDEDEDLDDDELFNKECCENAITDAPPAEKRRRYFAMLDANPRFSEEQRKSMKAKYDENHPEGLKDSQANESAADYEKAMRMLYRSDDSLNDDVDTAYEENDYDDSGLINHAKYASSLRTGYKSLVEKNVTLLNEFHGDKFAKYAANLHTGYTRAKESTYNEYEDYAALSELYDNKTGAATESYDDYSDYDYYSSNDYATESYEDYSDYDIDESINSCQSALESMLADLNDM